MRIRFLDEESVLLNLETERYFGLDAVGTRMWQLVTSSPTIDAALAGLVDDYDAEPETLRADLAALLEHLVENGLIAMLAEDTPEGTPDSQIRGSNALSGARQGISMKLPKTHPKEPLMIVSNDILFAPLLRLLRSDMFG